MNNNGQFNFLDNSIYQMGDESDLFSTSGVQQQSSLVDQQTPPQPPQFSQKRMLPVNNNNGQFNFLNNSIYTIYDDEVSFSANETQEQQSQSVGQQTPPQPQQFSHFSDRSDLLIKLSRIIFEDFHNLILPLNNKNNVEQNEKNEEKFLDVIQKFLEICEHGVKGIRKICVEHLDPHSKIMLSQLILERAAYNLVIRIRNSNKLLNNNENLISTSFLTKLFRENVEFRRISTLLLWNEDCSMFAPTEFSAIAEADIVKLSEHDDIYACTKIRGPINVDSRFVDRIAAEDEEAVQTLNRVLFALLRSGRLQDAKTLLENVGLPSLSAFIIIREFLVNQKLSPLDRFDEHFNLAQSRMHFKQTARQLIPSDDERIQQADQCIWACLGAHLPTLLSYAQYTEDRFWAYLSCAAEAMLDKSLSTFHSKADEQLNLIAMDMEKEMDDLPQTVHSIFNQLRINEKSPFYALFEHLTLDEWENAAKFIDQYLYDKGQAPAHELRFFIHILLILKLTGQWHADVKIMDNLIEIYANLLEEMKLNGIVPLYLFHLSARKSIPRMLDFLETLIFEPEQKEVLQNALNAGFDVAELCRSIFRRFKAKYTIDGTKSEQEMSKSTSELLRAWKWLIYCGPETIWDAIIEANYLMRKLFLHNRMEEAMALLKMIPENLGFAALDAFGGEFPDIQIPSNLLDAKHEFECYRFYFEALDRYEDWQKQMEGGQAPEIPAKLSDERWARMDIRRRTEYELNVKRARECLQKYYRLVELCKKRAVDMLESILKMPNGWLVKQYSDEDSIDPGVVERIKDFAEIRKHYLTHLLELLVDIHSTSKEPFQVMQIASLLIDPKYNLYKVLDKDQLQKLFAKISKSGAALL